MKALLTAVALGSLALSPTAFAQSSSPQSSSSQHQTGSQTNSTSNADQHMAAAQKIRQDLTSAGFTDVKVVAESFVVQAKSKEGNPVLMTIGPHGMSVFEAMNLGGSNSSGTTSGSDTTGSNTTGSNSGSTSNSGSSTGSTRSGK